MTPAAYEGLVNGGFEKAEGWIIRSNPVLAAYVTDLPVHGGRQSMRTGIPAGAAQRCLSYSPIEQAVAFPMCRWPRPNSASGVIYVG